MKKSSIWTLLLVFLCMTVVGVFAEGMQQPAAKTSTKTEKTDMKMIPKSSTKTLYDRLGGKDTVKIVVDEFIANVKTDKRVSTYFAKTDINKFKVSFENYICHKSGGPCKYEDKNMKDVHAGMNLNDKNFDAWMEDLSKAIDKAKVKQEDKKELLGFISPTRSEIVETKKVEEKHDIKTEKKPEDKKTEKSGEKKSGY